MGCPPTVAAEKEQARFDPLVATVVSHGSVGSVKPRQYHSPALRGWNDICG